MFGHLFDDSLAGTYTLFARPHTSGSTKVLEPRARTKLSSAKAARLYKRELLFLQFDLLFQLPRFGYYTRFDASRQTYSIHNGVVIPIRYEVAASTSSLSRERDQFSISLAAWCNLATASRI